MTLSRAAAISKKRTLLMTIRSNKSYRGYSSFTNGHSRQEREKIITECEKELSELVVPDAKIVIDGYMFTEKDGSYIGTCHTSDYSAARQELEDAGYNVDVLKCKVLSHKE